MDTSPERDRSVERLLRSSAQLSSTREGTEECLDAETLVAWADGDLTTAALEAAILHAADCGRCQSLMGAMVRTSVAVPVPSPSPDRRRWLWWAVPITATATALGLWVVVPSESPAPPRVASADVELQSQISRNDLPSLLPAEPEPSKPAERAAPVPSISEKDDSGSSLARREAAAETATPTAPPLQDSAAAPSNVASTAVAAPPPATESRPQPARSPFGKLAETVAVSQLAAAAVEIPTPDPAVRWRIVASKVERSTNGGNSWTTVPTDSTATLTAGAAPSTTVCWLVGRNGLVLLSTDGRAFRRIPFPDMTDLSGVQATSGTAASVSAADGRRFVTSDGGQTWTR